MLGQVWLERKKTEKDNAEKTEQIHSILWFYMNLKVFINCSHSGKSSIWNFEWVQLKCILLLGIKIHILRLLGPVKIYVILQNSQKKTHVMEWR